MTYDTNDAKKLFTDPFSDEVTVSLPEDTQRVMRAVTRECSELGRHEAYSEKTIETSAVFVIEHGSGIRPLQLQRAAVRASLRPQREDLVVNVRGKARTIRVVTATRNSR
jgi:hypothetical protein